MLKVTLAQLNYMVGDIRGNIRRMREAAAKADADQADLVVFSAGIRPQDELGRQAGLEVAERGGIVVNNQCRTSDPAIFAIGECASWNGQIFGLVAPGYQMARLVAAQVLGRDGDAFTGAFLARRLAGDDVSTALEYGAATAALKRTIPGDIALVTREEVEAVIDEESGEISR